MHKELDQLMAYVKYTRGKSATVGKTRCNENNRTCDALVTQKSKSEPEHTCASIVLILAVSMLHYSDGTLPTNKPTRCHAMA